MSKRDSLLREGENCWRIGEAERIAWLVDGEEYFGALRSSIEAARREILIVGWDIDSRVELIRDEDHPHYPSPLAETLEAAVERNRDLMVYLLSWDFAMIYVLERQLLPAYRFGWQQRERLHFKLDDRHASGASHHQKIVVVDGEVAYTGGFDLTKSRWDTREHAPDDARRRDPDDSAYRPFHDVQAVVSGAAARDLRELACFRWKNATGESLPELAEAQDDEAPDVWPEGVEPRARDTRVAIARTWVAPDGDERTREVEALFLDLVSAARESIYIENQYFTSRSITEALARRLREEDGPEVVLVLPGETSGWLEQATMETLRAKALNHLGAADEHDRLRVLAPVRDGLDGADINVHSKIVVVDDRWARIGSSNVSKRSMGLDSECDLVIEDFDGAVPAMLRADLLAEHLGGEEREIGEMIAERGLLATLDAHDGGQRRLAEIAPREGEWGDLLEPLAGLADLEAPMEQMWPRLAEELIGGEGEQDTESGETRVRERRRAARNAEAAQDERKGGAGNDGGGEREAHREGETADGASGADATGEGMHAADGPRLPPRAAGWLFLGLLAAAAGLWALWQAGSGFDPASLLSTLREVAAHPLAALVAVPAFIAGSLVIAPVTGMIALCALLFDPWTASAAAIAGTLAATAVNHEIGRRLGDAAAAWAPDTAVERMRGLARSSDAWSLAGLRLIPIAPFTVVNLVAGAFGVKLGDFLLGTVIGMGPGIVLICFTVDRARAALSGEPVFDPWIVAAMALAGIALIVMRVIQKRGPG